MAEQATVTAKITYPSVPGGPNVSPVFGSPITNPASEHGPQLDFNEKVEGNYVIPASGTVDVDFQTLSKASFIYVGTDQPIRVFFNGGAEYIDLEGSPGTDEAGGWVAMFRTDLTAVRIISTAPINAKVVVILLGD